MKRILFTVGCIVLLSGAAHADRFTMEFGDTSRPGTVKITGGGGDVIVEGYDGKEVVVVSGDGSVYDDSEIENERARGLRRLAGSGMNVASDKESNLIVVTRSFSTQVAMNIRVPYNTSILIGGNFNGGNVEIHNVTGEIDVNTMAGDITLENVSGSLSAHSMDGEIVAQFDRIDPDKPLSFSTMDGDIDVTLPTDIKASVKFSSMDGDIYTDFDIQRDAEGAQREMDKNREQMKEMSVHVKEKGRNESPDITITPKTGMVPDMLWNLAEDMQFNFNMHGVPATTFYGTINGGGQYIQINTMDGDIYFRRKK